MKRSALSSWRRISTRLSVSRGISHDLAAAHLRDLFGGVTKLGQHFVGVLAEQRRAGDFGREGGKFDRTADRQVLAALFLIDFNDGAAGAQRWIAGNFLHRQHGSAGNFELAQNLDRLELGLVRKPLLDLRENFKDARLPRLRRRVMGILRPFGLADSLTGPLPVLL